MMTLCLLLPFCFLVEKSFYFTYGRKNEKKPVASFEDKDECCMPDLTTQSRRHATKSMIMGIVAPPSPPLISWLCQARNG